MKQMLDPTQVEDIFAQAMSKPTPQERAAFLEVACAADAELRARVEQLLAAHEAAGGVLPEIATVAPSPVSEQSGKQIGRYKLLEQIGEGGFGVVFMAEQEHPVRRKVALKIIKLGMDTRQVVARFEAERQALAMMEHENIARVFDAGATDTGRPYFVMELVKGTPITQYCDQNKLPIAKRLDLFIQVCQAVQHAHQKGIIHRDLKPSNAMVTVLDDRPVPKIIDFGVAKATQAKLTDATLFTGFRQIIGTPTYMSPEQAGLSGNDIDTRSDIYSLGVLLYELLTGTTPFDSKQLMSAAYEEMQRIIREVDPPRPSTRLSDMNETLPSVAAQRAIEPRKLDTLLRGELDWIVMRCLEKDRNRRYPSTGALVLDVQRHLNNEPVEARAPTRSYRLKKFVRRNKLSVIAVIAVVTALLLGLIFASIGFRRARQEAARAEEVSQFLKDTLVAAGPSVARGRDSTLLREILQKTADRIDREVKNQPEVQGDLWFTLGATYHDISDYPRAIASYQRAVDSYRLALGNQNIKLAKTLGNLGVCQAYPGDVPAGMASAKLGLEIARKMGDKETLASCLQSYARTFDASGAVPSSGEPYLREAVALRRQLGNDPLALATSLSALSLSLSESNPEVEPLCREALALHRQHLEPDHPLIARDLSVLGQNLLMQGRIAEAETALREAFDLQHKLYGSDSPVWRWAMEWYARALVLAGKADQAEALVREATEKLPSDPEYWRLLGHVQGDRGNWQGAVQQFTRAQPLARSEIAIALLKTGQLDEYRRYRHEALLRGSVASSLMLLPVDGADLDVLRQLPDKPPSLAVGVHRKAQNCADKALTEYRRGNFQAAHRWAGDTVITDNATEEVRAHLYLIQALASARLGQMETARTELAKAEAILDAPNIQYGFYGRVQGLRIADYLRREATQLLGIPQTQPSTAAATRP